MAKTKEKPTTKEGILAAVKAGEMDLEEAAAALESLAAPGLSCKVSPKGGVSVYGLQNWPVTLYAQQWARLIAFSPEVAKFIRENQAALKTK